MSLNSQSNLQSIFRMYVPLKIIACSIRSVIKPIKSVMPLPRVQRDFLPTNTLGSLDPLWWICLGVWPPRWWIHQGVSTTLWWIHQGVIFIVYLEQASEQVYKKTFLWQKIDLGVKTPSLFAGKSWLPYVVCTCRFFVNQFRLTPWCVSSVMNTPESHDSKVVSTPGSWLQLQITPRIFEKIWNPF